MRLRLSVPLLLVMLIAPGSASAALQFHYQAPSLAGIEGNYWTGQQGTMPTEHTFCYAAGFGSNAFADPIGWRLSDFTNYIAEGDMNTAHQRGYNGNAYGTTGCQVKGTGMGFMLNSNYASPVEQPADHVRGMQQVTTWDGPVVYPWRGYGSNASLRIQADIVVNPGAADFYTAQYATVTAWLEDNVNHRALWYVVGMYDNRGGCAESISNDNGGYRGGCGQNGPAIAG